MGRLGRGLRRMPAGVWALGLVSLLMDVSSEMIHALLPVWLMVGLGASALTVGLIEGVAQATAAITKLFSGALSDRLGRRKPLVLLGYALAAVTKPVFAMAPSAGWVAAARFADRVGKGIRGAPRDALLADLAPEDIRGAAIGLRQSLDTAGAFLGPLLAVGLMWVFADNFRAVFWASAVPAVLAVALILFAVREPPRAGKPVRAPLSRAGLGRLGRRYRQVVAVAVAFTLARFSEAFLVLRAEGAGLSFTLLPLVFVALNLAYFLSAYPAGAVSDRVDRTLVLVPALVLLAAAQIALAVGGAIGIGAGVILWGLHMGLSEGILSALVADSAPAELRGTAYGVFHLVTGVAMLLASAIAGALWQFAGPAFSFGAGAGFAAIALAGVVALRRQSAARG